MFLEQLLLTLTLFRLKMLFNLCSLWKCFSNKFGNTRPMLVDNNNNNGYFYVLFLWRAHSPFIKKNNNDVNIELEKTNRLKALCMMQIKK